ncbi:MAG: hypothetical protein ABH804_00900 [archaeon]
MVSKKEANRGVLYSAFDESNHSRGDIIVGVFSMYLEDILEVKCIRRDYNEVRKFLADRGRNYRIAILSTLKEFYQTRYNLHLIAPFMINDFLGSQKNTLEFSKLNLIFDGFPNNKWNKIIKENLANRFKSIEISNYWGRKKKRGYPRLLEAADVTASEVFRGSCKGALNHEKIIRVPAEELIKRKIRFETL